MFEHPRSPSVRRQNYPFHSILKQSDPIGIEGSKMAYVKTDAELMTNLIAAKPVPTGSHFAAALDESSRPMVVSLSDDKVPKLQISMSSFCHIGNVPLIELNNEQYVTILMVDNISLTWGAVSIYPRGPLSKRLIWSKMHPKRSSWRLPMSRMRSPRMWCWRNHFLHPSCKRESNCQRSLVTGLWDL